MQFGFKNSLEKGTILYAIIRTKILERKDIFICFIDYQKAFENI